MTREYGRKTRQTSQNEADSGILQRSAVRTVPATRKTPLASDRLLGESSLKQSAMQIPAIDRDRSAVQPKLMLGSRWSWDSSEDESPGMEVQAKLAIGQPDDKYEREAERVAAEVTRRLNGSSREILPEGGDRTVAAPEVRTKTTQSPIQTGEKGAISPELEVSIKQAKGSGQSLPKPLKSKMEQAFGEADFAGVKVHTGTEGDRLNRALQARAFTTGQDIFFRKGEYNGGSHRGQELLAHELTHVLQQNGETVQRIIQLDRDEGRFAKHHRERKETLDKCVAEEHQERIGDVCKKFKYIISIRETGALSIKRIKQGAKAKPHTILSKSIKQSSVENSFANEVAIARTYLANLRLRKLEKWDLDGFVGMWSPPPERELLGLRIDNMPTDVREKFIQRNKKTLLAKEAGVEYVPIDFEHESGGLAVKILKKQPDWQKYLYTGDYDLHETYAAQGGGPANGQVTEGSWVMKILLTRLNKGVGLRGNDLDENKPLVELVGKGDNKRIQVTDAYAMFQHGPQSTYPKSMLLEWADQKTETLDLEGSVAQESNEPLEGAGQKTETLALVRSVAQESNEPLAWCIKGDWYVTMNKEEHDILRRSIVTKLTKPHTWFDDYWKTEEDAIPYPRPVKKAVER